MIKISNKPEVEDQVRSLVKSLLQTVLIKKEFETFNQIQTLLTISDEIRYISNYLKGSYFHGKKISRISRFLLKFAKLNFRENFQNRASAKLNSRKIFQNWVSAKLKIINVNIELP